MTNVAARALACLDLTDLSEGCTAQGVTSLIANGSTRHGKVAAICIWPQFVSQAVEALHGSGIKVATVINFPRGGEDIERSVEDATEALRDAADEIDLVIPFKALLRGDEGIVRDMISAVRDHVPRQQHLKTILETGELHEARYIKRASEIAIAAGAHFLKTSTGKTAISATPEAARIMLQAIKQSGKPVGFKASGGIRTLADAELYLGIADDIMGPDWATPSTFRFGASGLLDALVAELDRARTSGSTS